MHYSKGVALVGVGVGRAPWLQRILSFLKSIIIILARKFKDIGFDVTLLSGSGNEKRDA